MNMMQELDKAYHVRNEYHDLCAAAYDMWKMWQDESYAEGREAEDKITMRFNRAAEAYNAKLKEIQ